MALSDSQSHSKEEAGIEVDNNKEHQVEEEQGKGENNRIPAMPNPAMPPNPAVPATQLTIFYNGAISVFDEITPEKAQAIMLIAAASAAASRTENSNKTKINMANAVASSAGIGIAGGFSTSAAVSAAKAAALTRSLSQQSSSVAATAAGPNATSISKLQAELPIARRTSLQQFLEKRRSRIVSKAPYASAKKSDEGLEACTEAKPQLI